MENESRPCKIRGSWGRDEASHEFGRSISGHGHGFVRTFGSRIWPVVVVGFGGVVEVSGCGQVRAWMCGQVRGKTSTPMAVWGGQVTRTYPAPSSTARATMPRMTPQRM